MNVRFPILGFLLSACVATAQDTPRAIQVVEPPAQAPSHDDDKVISRTNQFRVSGGSSLDRATVAMLAEETKDELLYLTGEKDEWKLPVAIFLHGKTGDPLPARTIATGQLIVEGIRQLRIDKHLGPGLEQERFKRSVTAILLYERALKALPAGTSENPLRVPPWLTDGLREANAWRLNQSERRLYEALFKQGGLFKIDDLFATTDHEFENLDGATRAAFRVSAGALVMALLEQPQGKEGFRAFLTDVAGYEGEMPGLLRRNFPELNLSETSLAKWWALQLANKGGLNLLTDIFTIAQTEAALAELLLLNFRTEEGGLQQKELAAWPELAALPEPERFAAVRSAQDALIRLSFRCFPSYRPLLVQYQAILGAIVKNQTKDVLQGLAELQENRTTMVTRAVRARDFLDWFEITRARQTSGAFDDYLRLKEGLKSKPHLRQDDLSKYLDRMETIFNREESPRRPGMTVPPPP